MRRSQFERDAIRRSGVQNLISGVTSIETNGQPPGGASGALKILSPMAEFVAPDTIRIDNGNSKDLPAAPVSADIDTDVNTAFKVAKIAGAATAIPIPNAPASLPQAEDRKITFEILFRGTGTDTVTFTGGAGGYEFANAASNFGITLAQFNELVAAAAGTNDAAIKVGFSYSERLNKWCCVALAGWFT